MHEVLVNPLGDLRLPRKSVVRLTDRPDMTLDVYRGRKTTTQQQQTNDWPGRVAQSGGHLTRKSGVLGSIPGQQLSVTRESICTKYWVIA